MISVSLGKAYGSRRSVLEWLSFSGMLLWENVLTIDNLRKRKVWILDWCYLCKCNGESIDLFLLHCPVDFWSMVLGLFGVSWVMPINCGAPCFQARSAWSSSKWSYMDACSPLFDVVSLEGNK